MDGLEVLQHQDGDDYGLLKSRDLRDWLRNFAASEHQSFCLINSRAPLLDLIDFTTYNHRDVEHLSLEEGRRLWQNLGVIGTSAETAKESLTLARRGGDKWDEMVSLAWQGWVAHLQGDLETASSTFQLHKA